MIGILLAWYGETRVFRIFQDKPCDHLSRHDNERSVSAFTFAMSRFIYTNAGSMTATGPFDAGVADLARAAPERYIETGQAKACSFELAKVFGRCFRED